MSSFVIFVILVLATGALAAPYLGFLPTTYNEECGIKIGVAEEEFGSMILGSETFMSYVECEMERQGVMEDGQFKEEFINEQQTLAEESEDIEEQLRAKVATGCIIAQEKEGREAASEFAGCTFVMAIFLEYIKAGLKQSFLE